MEQVPITVLDRSQADPIAEGRARPNNDRGANDEAGNSLAVVSRKTGAVNRCGEFLWIKAPDL
jgi:hypothetical protein